MAEKSGFGHLLPRASAIIMAAGGRQPIMRNLLDPIDRDDILRRLVDLSPDAKRRWGTMSVERMLCHVADQLRFAVEDLDGGEPSGVYANPFLRWLAISWLPWPHQLMIPTAPSLLQTKSDTFAMDAGALRVLIERFAKRGRSSRFGSHPMFGRLSNRLWGRLAWRHLDYHFRQFGA